MSIRLAPTKERKTHRDLIRVYKGWHLRVSLHLQIQSILDFGMAKFYRVMRTKNRT